MIQSPAKLNLGLRIVGRREDGYHFLESLFWPINFCDSLTFFPSSQPKVECFWAKDAPFGEIQLFQNRENLVGKIFSLLPRQTNQADWNIHISKRIPLGGGLGGCSSNCGTALSFLVANQLMQKEEAENLAVQLGADVPFFLRPQPTWVTGIGENRCELTVEPQLKERLFFLVALFPFASSTPDVFERFRHSKAPFSPSTRFDTARPLTFDSLSSYLKSAKNDLEAVVKPLSEPIAKTLDILGLTDCLYSGLSGTGSTCFAVYSSLEKRLKASKEIEQNCRRYSCKTLFAETF